MAANSGRVVLKRVIQRWCATALGFLVAALVIGVSVRAGLECLRVFIAVYAAAALMQQRQRVAAWTQARRRPRARSDRGHRDSGDEKLDADGWPLAERL